MNLDWLKLLLFTMLIAGFFVVREDLKTKRIRNKYILWASIMGALLYLGALATSALDVNDLARVLLNVLTAFLISFAIWKLGLWPAGDAKLFVTFSFLLPLQYYSKTYLAYFPAFAFLINIFVVYLIFIILKSIPWTWRSFRKFYLRGCFRRKFLARYVKRRGRALGRIVRDKGFVSRILFRGITKTVFISIAAVCFTKREFHFKSFLFYFLFFGSLQMLFRFFVKFSGMTRVRTGDLKAGMNLSEELTGQLKKSPEFFQGLDTLRAEGLTQRQADLIREYLYARKIHGVYIYETIPFSPFIILGAMTTILARGTVLNYINPMIGHLIGR